MVRRLPEEPLKRRHQIFKRIYQHMAHWQALMEDRGMDAVITDEFTGEDIYIGDLLIGLDSLPPRQRQAFDLICLRGYTETAARDELLPNSKSSTPVQQYADSGLARMVSAYDLKQIGSWPPVEEPKLAKPKKKKTRRKTIMAALLHPLLRRHLEDARTDILTQIEGLKVALEQVNVMLGEDVAVPAQQPASPASPPAPTSAPKGKPTLAEAAKELAAAG